MAKAKTLKHLGSDEFSRLTSIADPLRALDRCRDAIEGAKKNYWEMRHIFLGVLAASYEQICQSRKAWCKFMQKAFWNDAYGSRPTTKDRRTGLFFVIRYGNKAQTHKDYRLAWRHTLVAEYLLTHGVKPSDFATYLGKKGQGINATYERALLVQKLKKGDAVALDAANARARAKVAANDQNSSRQADRKGTVGDNLKGTVKDGLGRVLSTRPKARLDGKRDLMEPLFHLSDGSTIPVLLKAVRDEKGCRLYRVVKLFSNSSRPMVSERRKSAAPRTEPTSRRAKHSGRKPRRSAQ